MLNKDFFIVNENDLEVFKLEIDLYSDELRNMISGSPKMTVETYSDFEESIYKKAEELLTKYSYLFMVNQTTEISNDYNLMIKYQKDKLSDLGYNRDYYNFIKTLIVEDEQDKILKDKILKDFEDRGLNLSTDKQSRLIEISKELGEAGIGFLQNISEARKSWEFEIKDEVYQSLNDKHKKMFKNLKMDYNINQVLDLLETCDNEDLRRDLFEKNKLIANKGTDFDNSELINKIVLLKQESAKILGKKSVSELILSESMSGDVESAMSFISMLSDKMLPFAIEENNQLNIFVENNFKIKEINKHSLSYYSNKMKEDLFSYKKDEERKYFDVDNALKGTFKLINKMFNISFEKEHEGFILPENDIPTYRIMNNGVFKGYVAIDLFERKMKKSGAWVSNYISPTKDKDGILTLTTNFDKDKEGLSFDDITTLLHEFGHLVHAISSETKYRKYSGTNGLPRDAVEIPSQMLEKFSLDKVFLNDISENKIPEDLIEKANNMQNFRVANFYTRQIGFALYDLELYQGTKEDFIELYKKCVDKTNPRPVDKDTNFPMTFSHIFSGGYSSGYYGYLWSDVYSVDAFSFIKEDREKLGKEYKEKVLSKGSAFPAKDLYIEFRGQNANIDNFLDFYNLKEKPKNRMKM